jgi:hypothetical protein
VAPGRLDHARDRRGFRERDVGDVFAEEHPRSLGHAVDRVRSALAQVDVVQVELEDLVLGGARFEDDREELLLELAPVRLLLRQEEVLHELLRQGAAADEVGPIALQVGDDRADDADRVDAGVIIEAPVLDREHRLDHLLGDQAQ